jgi:branched-subunit amino acid transport protein
MNFYLVFGGVALASLIVKSLFLCFVPAHRLPVFLEKTMRYIPASALAALIAPAVFYTRIAGAYHVSLPRILAGALAFMVALKSRNLFVTLFSGLLMLWFFSTVMVF